MASRSNWEGVHTIGRIEKKGEDKRERGAGGTYVTKLTPELTARVCDAIRKGASLDTAARYAGIARSTARDWLADGRAALEKHGIGQIPEALADKAAFVFEVEHAMSGFKLDALSRIIADESWTSDAWLLERRFPDEYGKRQRIDHANADGAPFMVTPTPVFDPSKLSNEELDTVIDLLEKARPDGMKSPTPRELGDGGDLRVIEG